jgi:hypothetical protein
MAEPTIRSRVTIRRAGMSARGAKLIEPWVYEEAKPNTLLAGVEKAFFDALAAVDALEDRRAAAVKAGALTPEGIAADSLQFAAGTLAPQLKRARQVLERAKAEVVSERGKLTLRPVDKTDAASAVRRRLWKLDKFNALPDAERNSRSGRDTVDHGRNGHDDHANAVCGVLRKMSDHLGYDLFNGCLD